MHPVCLMLVFALAVAVPAQTLKTKWASKVTANHEHQEYPRPQMVRKEWVNLNGTWQCAIQPPRESDEEEGDHEEGDLETKPILVPFPVESQLSGFHGHVGPKDTIVYTRTFERPKGDRVLLHFEAVDWNTLVMVNGVSVGTHQGGYDPFSFDITSALRDKGPQKLEVRVMDPTDTGFQPRGKQVLKPEGIFYTPCSGIWQTVWLEAVPASHVDNLKIVASLPNREVTVAAVVGGAKAGQSCTTQVLSDGKLVAEKTGPVTDGNSLESIPVPAPIAWSPEDPHLYTLRVILKDDKDKTIDEVTSYCGFREISLLKNDHGQPVLALNGKPYFFIGPLDQGFWPDGVYTAPSDEAMKYDLEVTKRLGFNMIRKHVKVEPRRWYYWCDKLGIAVLQDMPSGDRSIGPEDPDIQRTPASADDFKTELKAMVDTHFNHPCIVTWVLYNEGWGQWNTPEMTKWLKDYDPTRLVDATTGWSDRGVGDYSDIHDYPGPGIPAADPNRALFLGEFGGLGLPEPGHMWLEKGWGYQSFKTREELTDRFVQIFQKLLELKKQGLSGAVYTQTTDCETELNGLMTYDRAIIKMDEKRVREAVEALRKD